MFHRPKPYGDTAAETEKPTEEAKGADAVETKAAGETTENTTAETAKPNPFAASTPASAPTPTNSPFRSTSATSESDTKTTSSSSSLFSSGKDTSPMSDQDKTNETEADASKKPLDIPAGNNPFQRPQAATGTQQTPGSYGTYSPAPYAASTPAMGTPAAGMSSSLGSSAHGRRLVIGEGITMSGEIESCDHLLVEGTVEAALKGAKVLEISSAGTFYGTVEIENATIAGRFEGDITISGRLTVKTSGSVTGTISYGELAIEAGATLDGTLTPLNATAAAGGRKGRKTGNDAELPLSRRASGE